MGDKATYIDLASDSFNFQRFLSKTGNDHVKVMNLRNPFVTSDFIEDDLKTILTSLANYKSLELGKEFTIENTLFEISICSDFGVFLELMELLPYEKFITLESLNIPSAESLKIENIPSCPDFIKYKYENEI